MKYRQWFKYIVKKNDVVIFSTNDYGAAINHAEMRNAIVIDKLNHKRYDPIKIKMEGKIVT